VLLSPLAEFRSPRFAADRHWHRRRRKP